MENEYRPTHAYIARRKCCNTFVMISTDDEDMKAENAKEVSRCIKEGYEVDRVTIAEAHELLGKVGWECTCTPRQLVLF
ncbi:MAG TPA: hypothetical protein PKW33_15415 [Anaerolineaceae bacterium]|nr:hypothetical protein [Anaerolineaceae bacterium]